MKKWGIKVQRRDDDITNWNKNGVGLSQNKGNKNKRLSKKSIP